MTMTWVCETHISHPNLQQNKNKRNASCVMTIKSQPLN